MKPIFTALLAIFTVIFVSAQRPDAAPINSAITGTVTDAQSGFPLPGVTVILLNSDPIVGAITDMDGQFKLSPVPVGRHGVRVSSIGYDVRTLDNLLVNSAKELNLNVALTEQITRIDGVEIVAQDDKTQARNDMATVSARSFTVEEAMRYSGGLQDPSRMAQNFAGVSNASDDRNDIVIRGNSPTGVLWRMEGIDIPSPNHFSAFGTTGGPVTMLNINNLSNSDFLTSAFPADYGNALSGVFDLRLRNGNKNRYEFTGQIGFNGFELGAEGPLKIGNGGSFLINYRYSTLEVFNALGLEFGTGTAIPQFQDLTFKVDIPTKKAGRFGVFGVGGTSYIEFLASDATETNLFSTDAEDTRFSSTTGWSGITHSYFFNERTRSNLVIAASTAGTNGSVDSLSLVNGSPIRNFGTNQLQNKVTARLDINSKRNARNTLKFGVQTDLFDFDFKDSVRVASDAFFYRNNFEDNAVLLQSYASWQHRAGEKLTINTGLHGQLFMLNEAIAIEPRVGIRYQVKPNQSINFGAGLHSQMQPVPVYFNQQRFPDADPVLTNDQLGFNRSLHTALGYDNSITEHARIKVEVYYQHLFDIAVDRGPTSFSMLNVGTDFTMPSNGDLVNTGEGRNYGVEFTLERFFHRGFYGLATASLFESFYTGSDQVERSTAFNTNFVFNVLGGKEWVLSEKNTVSVDTRATLAGGQRYTPIDLEASIAENREVRRNDVAFSEQYPAYFRWDLKLTFRRNGEKFTQQWSVDLRNLTNRANIFSENFNARSGKLETRFQLGFFPDIQYRIYF